MIWIEAIILEKALVTSDNGWAKKVMLDGETGFTVDTKDHHLYAEKILQLMNDTTLAEKMGRAAREQVIKKFSAEVVVEDNIRFHEKIGSSEYRVVSLLRETSNMIPSTT